MKEILLFLLLILNLYGEEIVEKQKDTSGNNSFVLNLEYLKSLDKGIKRDFFINEFLQQDINSQQAFETLSLLDNMTTEIFHNFANKYKDDETLAVSMCMNMDVKELIDSYADCIKTGLSLKKASNLSSIDLKLLMQKLSTSYPILTKELKAIDSPIPFTKLIVLKKEQFYELFLSVSKNFREKYFNYKLPTKTFKRVFSDKKSFNRYLDVVLRNKKLDTLNKSLLRVDDSALNANSSFLLGLNAIRYEDLNLAYTYLNNALNKYIKQREIDKVNFWLYKITKDIQYLVDLQQSAQVDIYTIFVNEMTKKKTKNATLVYNVVFENLIKRSSLEKRAFFYALVKVKSDFNKDKISKDFDLGLMQLNILLIKSLIKENNLTMDYNELFTIKENIKFAKLYENSFSKLPNNFIYKFLRYENKKGIIDSLTSPEDSYLEFEFAIDKQNEYIKELITNYYSYFNSNLSKKDKKISLLSIFEKSPLFHLNQSK